MHLVIYLFGGCNRRRSDASYLVAAVEAACVPLRLFTYVGVRQNKNVQQHNINVIGHQFRRRRWQSHSPQRETESKTNELKSVRKCHCVRICGLCKQSNKITKLSRSDFVCFLARARILLLFRLFRLHVGLFIRHLAWRRKQQCESQFLFHNCT